MRKRKCSGALAQKLVMLVTLGLLALSFPIAAQEHAADENPTSDGSAEAAETAEAEQDALPAARTLSPLKNHAAFISFGPLLLVNTDSSKRSAPSPIMFGGGLGATFFQNAPLSIQPRFTFFTNYYLWNGEAAHPAEVENRTALALSFLIDGNAVKVLRRGKNVFQIGGGVSLLVRVPILANGVAADDAGGTATSTAGDDVASMRDYFWSDLRFLYPNALFCWLHELPNGWYAGASVSVYVPLGSLTHGDGAEGLVATAAFRLTL